MFFILYCNIYCEGNGLIICFFFSRFERLLIFGVVGYFLDVDYYSGFLKLEFDVFYCKSDVYYFESVCSGLCLMIGEGVEDDDENDVLFMGIVINGVI